MRAPTSTAFAWGEVTDDQTEIVAEFAIPGLNPVDISVDALGMNLEASFNGVTMASSHHERLRFASDRTALVARAHLEHGTIPRWWATHVANGERSTISVDPALSVRGLLGSYALDAPGLQHTVETDIPGAIAVEDGPSKEVMGRTIVAIDRITAEWVDVDATATEMTIAATVSNGTRIPLPFDELRYDVTMNGVQVGEGASRDVRIPPKDTGTVQTRASFDNETIEAWWPTHVRNGETTTIGVDLYATASLFGGTREFHHRYEETFETDLLSRRSGT